MKKISTALGATMLVGLSSLAVPAFSADPGDPQKVFVCKYVGTPDLDERLQTGNNPIEVSVNAIPGYTGQEASALIGTAFADAQGRSIVIAVSAGPGGGQGDEPTIEDCPAPDGPEEPPVVPPVEPPVEPPVAPPVEPPVAPPVELGESVNSGGGNNNGGVEVLGDQASANNSAPAQANQQGTPASSTAQQVPTAVNAGIAGEDVAQGNALSSPAGIVLLGALVGLLAIAMRRSLAHVGGGRA